MYDHIISKTQYDGKTDILYQLHPLPPRPRARRGAGGAEHVSARGLQSLGNESVDCVDIFPMHELLHLARMRDLAKKGNSYKRAVNNQWILLQLF